LEVDPSKKEIVKHQEEVDTHLEADLGELLDDYEPTLVYVEDFQLNFEESLHENAQAMIGIPLEDQNLIDVGSLLFLQEDEPMDFQIQVRLKELILALKEKDKVCTKTVQEPFKRMMTLS